MGPIFKNSYLCQYFTEVYDIKKQIYMVAISYHTTNFKRIGKVLYTWRQFTFRLSFNIGGKFW